MRVSLPIYFGDFVLVHAENLRDLLGCAWAAGQHRKDCLLVGFHVFGVSELKSAITSAEGPSSFASLAKCSCGTA